MASQSASLRTWLTSRVEIPSCTRTRCDTHNHASVRQLNQACWLGLIHAKQVFKRPADVSVMLRQTEAKSQRVTAYRCCLPTLLGGRLCSRLSLGPTLLAVGPMLLSANTPYGQHSLAWPSLRSRLCTRFCTCLCAHLCTCPFTGFLHLRLSLCPSPTGARFHSVRCIGSTPVWTD